MILRQKLPLMNSKRRFKNINTRVFVLPLQVMLIDVCMQLQKNTILKRFISYRVDMMLIINFPWITRNVKRTLLCKARLYKKAKKSNKWMAYRQCQKECKRQLRNAEWQHTNKVIDEDLQNNKSTQNPFGTMRKERITSA